VKRIITLFLLLCVITLTVVISGSKAQQNAQRAHATPAPSGKIAIPCPAQLDGITDCPDTGCGPSLDPHLNTQKNIRSLSGDAEPMTIQEMKDLPDPVEDFEVGDTREKLQALGERNKIVVVANALAVRKGSAESCNCKLTRVADTDNHIVLVDRVLRVDVASRLKICYIAAKKTRSRLSLLHVRDSICRTSSAQIFNL